MRPGEQATSSTCKRKGGRAGDVEDKRGAEQPSGVARGAAARVDAEVKTMLPASLRIPTSRGSAQFATASRKRTA